MRDEAMAFIRRAYSVLIMFDFSNKILENEYNENHKQ